MTKSSELCQVKRPRDHAAAGATCVCLSPAKRFPLQGTPLAEHCVLGSQGQVEVLKDGGREGRAVPSPHGLNARSNFCFVLCFSSDQEFISAHPPCPSL